MKQLMYATCVFTAITALTTPAFAVDGVTLINQATVQAAGGFPYIINQPGSYRLSGNIVVPGSAYFGIKITAPNVTLDLNGFTLSCANCGLSSTIGIDSSAANTAIVNGTVTGFPYMGIFFEAGQANLDRVSLTSNITAVVADGDLTVSGSTFAGNTDGIDVNGDPPLLVVNSKFIRNQTVGIFGPSVNGAVISGNVFYKNGNSNPNAGAISISSGTVTANTFTNNASYAISSVGGGPVVYSQNSFLGVSDNPVGNGTVSAGNNGCYGGIPLGGKLC